MHPSVHDGAREERCNESLPGYKHAESTRRSLVSLPPPTNRQRAGTFTQSVWITIHDFARERHNCVSDSVTLQTRCCRQTKRARISSCARPFSAVVVCVPSGHVIHILGRVSVTRGRRGRSNQNTARVHASCGMHTPTIPCNGINASPLTSILSSEQPFLLSPSLLCLPCSFTIENLN